MHGIIQIISLHGSIVRIWPGPCVLKGWYHEILVLFFFIWLDRAQSVSFVMWMTISNLNLEKKYSSAVKILQRKESWIVTIGRIFRPPWDKWRFCWDGNHNLMDEESTEWMVMIRISYLSNKVQIRTPISRDQNCSGSRDSLPVYSKILFAILKT
jgi:hypothetical protein